MPDTANTLAFTATCAQRKRAVIGHPFMGRGGSEARVMWLIEALKERYDVTVLTTGGWNLDILNSYYGTNVRDSEIQVRIAAVPSFMKHLEAAALRNSCYQRLARRIAHEYDLRISAYNMTDWGLPAIHFIADFSWSSKLRGSLDPPPPGFIYRDTPLRRTYLHLASAYGNRSTRDPLRDDMLIANSDWSASLIKRFYTVDCARVIYPPVWTEFPHVPWETKEPAFVMIGRIAPEKRIEEAIEILRAVRRRGYPVHLKLCGVITSDLYGRRVARLCRANADWIELRGSVQGAGKAEILTHCRFGIQTRQAEPFGISVAEMVKAGAIVFAPNGGGQTEIIGRPELLFTCTQDAADKICAVLADEKKQTTLRDHLQRRSSLFSSRQFVYQTRNMLELPRDSQLTQSTVPHRLKVVIGHPEFGFGGSESVAMWLIEALKHEFDLSVMTTGGWNRETLNQYYGTNVQENDVKIRIAPMPPLVKAWNTAALRGAYYQRFARAIGEEYDLCISTYNLTDWGKPALHYIADFTWHPKLHSLFTPPPMSFFYRNTFARAAYLRLANAIAAPSRHDGYQNDWLVANSQWTAQVLKQHCGINCARVIYPPVWEHFPAVTSDQKEQAFVMIGRVAVEKQIEQAIDVLEAVRGRGYAIKLHLCGGIENDAYGRKVLQLCRTHSDWIIREGLVQGAKKAQILTHCRFGLQMRSAEPFGISVAEMASAGAVVFAPNCGGQTEILDSPDLLFEDTNDAVEKICSVLSSTSSQKRLRDHIQSHAKLFSAENFMRESVTAIRSFLENEPCAASESLHP